MATQAEIKAMKREDLDAEAAAQGLDPAQYPKAEDLREAVMAKADDADAADKAAHDAETPDEQPQDRQRRKERGEKSTLKNPLREDAKETEVKATSEQEDLKAVAGTGHPTGFDKSGNPTFGKPTMGREDTGVDGSVASDKTAEDKQDEA